MGSINEIEKDLQKIQHQIDREYKKFAKRDFDLKLEHYNAIKPILEERDMSIQSVSNNDNGENFWERAGRNFPSFCDLLPSEDENFSLSWMESLKCWYEDEFICCVEITLSRNEYLNNRKLWKKFSLVDHTSEQTELKIKKQVDCLLFDFFNKNDYDLEVFDVLYELYVNGVYHYCNADDMSSSESE